MKIIKLFILLFISNIGFCVDGDGSGEPKQSSASNINLEQYILVDGDGSGITSEALICYTLKVDGDGSGKDNKNNSRVCFLKKTTNI